MLLNWRFQQALYRAYYDAYVRSRLLHETAIEERAPGAAARASEVGESRQGAATTPSESSARREVRPAPEWRLRVYVLAEALFQSIRSS